MRSDSDGNIEAFKLCPSLVNMNFSIAGTPLCIAIDRSNFNYAKKLIKAGADLNAASIRSDTIDWMAQRAPYISALHRALHSEKYATPNQKLIQALILNGAKIGQQINGDMQESIISAVENVYKEIFVKLISVEPHLNRDVIKCIFDQYKLIKLEEIAD